MQVLISDANVLIDMEDGGLLDLMFQLPYCFKVSDILFEEELSQHHPELIDKGLVVTELLSEGMSDAMRMSALYSGPSRHDCIAMALAKQEACPLLTGDRALRRAAETEAVVVMGTIWVVNQLVIHGLIDEAEAKSAYQQMEVAGSRLPWRIAYEELSRTLAELRDD